MGAIGGQCSTLPVPIQGREELMVREELWREVHRLFTMERAALDDLILRRLLQAEAERLNVKVDPGEEDVVFGQAHGGQPGESRLLVVESREKTEDLRQQILKGGDFGGLVRQHTKGGYKESGGDMGWVDPHALPPPRSKRFATRGSRPWWRP